MCGMILNQAHSQCNERKYFFIRINFLTNDDFSNHQDTKEDTTGCVFPFTFNGIKYNKCTKEGSSYSWCSFNTDFLGVWKYCNDQKTSDWSCLDSCTNYRGEEYPTCRSNFKNKRIYCTDKIKYLYSSDSQPVSADCPDKYKNIPFHTRCLTPAKYVTQEGIKEEEKQEIVDLHDRWRSDLEVPASAMMKMV